MRVKATLTRYSNPRTIDHLGKVYFCGMRNFCIGVICGIADVENICGIRYTLWIENCGNCMSTGQHGRLCCAPLWRPSPIFRNKIFKQSYSKKEVMRNYRFLTISRFSKMPDTQCIPLLLQD